MSGFARGEQHRHHIPSTPACVALTLIACLVFGSATHAQQSDSEELSSEQLTVTSGDLATALSGPREKAFLQILTEASLVRDPVQDTVFVYDLVVRYDPGVHHDEMAPKVVKLRGVLDDLDTLDRRIDGVLVKKYAVLDDF